MVNDKEHAEDLIAKRKSLGKKGIPKAVRRWMKRIGINTNHYDHLAPPRFE